jgi:hypothetical protein
MGINLIFYFILPKEEVVILSYYFNEINTKNVNILRNPTISTFNFFIPYFLMVNKLKEQ